MKQVILLLIVSVRFLTQDLKGQELDSLKRVPSETNDSTISAGFKEIKAKLDKLEIDQGKIDNLNTQIGALQNKLYASKKVSDSLSVELKRIGDNLNNAKDSETELRLKLSDEEKKQEKLQIDKDELANKLLTQKDYNLRIVERANRNYENLLRQTNEILKQNRSQSERENKSMRDLLTAEANSLRKQIKGLSAKLENSYKRFRSYSGFAINLPYLVPIYSLESNPVDPNQQIITSKEIGTFGIAAGVGYFMKNDLRNKANRKRIVPKPLDTEQKFDFGLFLGAGASTGQDGSIQTNIYIGPNFLIYKRIHLSIGAHGNEIRTLKSGLHIGDISKGDYTDTHYKIAPYFSIGLDFGE